MKKWRVINPNGAEITVMGRVLSMDYRAVFVASDEQVASCKGRIEAVSDDDPEAAEAKSVVLPAPSSTISFLEDDK